MQESVFTKIIKREIPADIVYENDSVIALLDIHPVNPGHTLVIIKEHYPTLESTPDHLLEAAVHAIKHLIPIIKAAVDAPGVNIHLNNDPVAGQEIPHLHFHIIPRFETDQFEHWHGDGSQTAAARAALAARMNDALNQLTQGQ